VKQYRGIVEMDKAQVNNAKLQLDYAQLTAPITGQVGLRQIDQGNVVHANDTNGLVVITQLQPINVVFTLPEDKGRK
jgi:multidrug efflux system membrane fusion protein